MRVLAQELTDRAGRAPDEVAVVDALGTHTIGEVVQAAHELAALLDDSLGGSPTVLVQADNTWRTLAAAVAVGLRGGMVAVFSGHALAAEFELAMEDIRPDAVFATGDVLERWAVSDEAFPDRRPALDGWTLATSGGPVSEVERWNGGAAVAMTSGSTGRPKCVVQSEESIRYAGRSTIDAIGLRPGDAVGAFVPLSSVAAFCFGMYLPAMLGGPMVSIDSWQPDLALRAMAEHEVRWTMLVPTMALQLAVRPEAEGRLAGLTAMTVGGGPMNADALGRAERTLGTTIIRVFGMSECLGHTTTRPDEEASTRLGADGRPFPGTEVRAVDDAGRAVEVGSVGAAQVRGPSLFVGYARDGKPSRDLTDDGFLPTGDLVRVNPDGTITILGRREADHHPGRPQHRHQRGRGGRGAHPLGVAGVRRSRAGRAARREGRGARRVVGPGPHAWRASRASWTRAGSRSPSGRSSSSSSRTCPRTGWESSRVATRPTSRSA